MNFSQLFNILLSVLPQLAAALETVAQAKGLPVDHPEVAKAVVEHLTAGLPNEPSLS
jgi:hypothetical protein